MTPSVSNFIANRSRDIAYILRMRPPLPVLRAYFRTLAQYVFNRSDYKRFEESVRQDLNELGNFSSDWFSALAPYWKRIFDSAGLRDRDIRALEIGSWEGRSASFLLESLPRASLVAVDTWLGSDEHDENAVRSVEARFDQNTARFGQRIAKFKGTSLSYFMSRGAEPEFDLIYIDGSHDADDVMCDAVLAFRLLKDGGVLVFDDYLWRYYEKPERNPAAAIHAFLRMKQGEYEVLSVYHQICLRKTVE